MLLMLAMSKLCFLVKKIFFTLIKFYNKKRKQFYQKKRLKNTYSVYYYYSSYFNFVYCLHFTDFHINMQNNSIMLQFTETLVLYFQTRIQLYCTFAIENMYLYLYARLKHILYQLSLPIILYLCKLCYTFTHMNMTIAIQKLKIVKCTFNETFVTYNSLFR